MPDRSESLHANPPTMLPRCSAIWLEYARWNWPKCAKLRGAQRHLPRAHQRAIDSDGEVDVRLADIGVVEKVVHAILERVDIEHPSPVRNLNTELVLFVALGWQRHKRILALLAGDVVEQARSTRSPPAQAERSARRSRAAPSAAAESRPLRRCADRSRFH